MAYTARLTRGDNSGTDYLIALATLATAAMHAAWHDLRGLSFRGCRIISPSDSTDYLTHPEALLGQPVTPGKRRRNAKVKGDEQGQIRGIK
jgi:hypothetical protein